MPLDIDALATEVVLLVKSALAPVQQQVAVQQAQIAALERRVQDDSLAKELGGLRERVAVVEVRPVQPGPPGDPGPPGLNGADGKPGLTYCGVFVDGKSYDVGELVTWGGSMWHCNEATETKPGDGSKSWTLAVKRGRDGKGGV